MPYRKVSLSLLLFFIPLLRTPRGAKLQETHCEQGNANDQDDKALWWTKADKSRRGRAHKSRKLGHFCRGERYAPGGLKAEEGFWRGRSSDIWASSRPFSTLRTCSSRTISRQHTRMPKSFSANETSATESNRWIKPYSASSNGPRSRSWDT